jgi:transcriptional regulator with XRE-family HTH domain
MIKVKEFIERVGIASQKELAKRLGVTQVTVSKWAKGTGTPTFEMCRTLLDMGMVVEELFGRPYPSSVAALEPQGAMRELMENSLKMMLESIRQPRK